MKGSRSPRISEFYCLKCKEENTPIVRMRMRKKYHVKTMYCPTCKENTQNLEIRDIDYKDGILFMADLLHDRYYSGEGYLFVKSKTCWFYKIDSKEKLYEYHQRLINLDKSSKYKELSKLINLKRIDILLSDCIFQKQEKILEKFGAIHITRKGGLRIRVNELERITNSKFIYPQYENISND